jgi:hypothetical protein
MFTGYKLRYINNKKIKISKKNDNNNLWKFIKINKNNYVIMNKNDCYIKINKFNSNCENTTVEEATQFNLIKIFEEVKINQEEKKIIFFNPFF